MTTSTALKLNIARSSKYKISSTSLFMYCHTSSSAFCSNKYDAQECCLRHLTLEQKWWKILCHKESCIFSMNGTSLLIWLLESIGKVQ